MQLTVKARGSYDKTIGWLQKLSEQEYLDILEICAQQGVDALARATPRDTGKTADSWEYEIQRDKKTSTIIWKNSNTIVTGEPIAIMLQYGHGTGTGGYVMGRDYINPAIAPVFSDISEAVRKAIQP